MADEDTEESRAGAVGTVEAPTGRPKRSEPSTSRRQRLREPVNAIEPARKQDRTKTTPPVAAAAEGTAVPSASSLPSPPQRADTDPWTVPESVRERFVQDGHRFYFPDGAPAFKDRGRRLTTTSENTQVIHSLIEIAHSRGWTEITVKGTERFRHDAWQQARLAGLEVRGYRPNEEERAQVIRALGRNLGRTGDKADSISAYDPAATPAPADPRRAARAAPEPRERIAGKLLDHGRDSYRHDPNEDPSYFVRLETRDGVREIWGRDIERAVGKSLTQPKIGDEVILQRTGRDVVTVTREERDPEGQFRSKNVEVFRNRWVIEKQSFFEKRAAAAQIVRNGSIGAREAVREHPELAGTYLNLRAAELASRSLRDAEDQRRFLAQVRSALANDIERGEPLQPVRLRERAPRIPAQLPREADREISR